MRCEDSYEAFTARAACLHVEGLKTQLRKKATLFAYRSHVKAVKVVVLVSLVVPWLVSVCVGLQPAENTTSFMDAQI